MEEEPSNGGLLYHEVQESKLCGVHCVNTVLQGPFFTEVDLAAIASDLDRKERQIILEAGTISDDFIRFDSEESHNVSMDGDFSIQVLQKALEVWDLQVIPLDCPVAAPAQLDPELENAFICHLQDHWFSIRKVNGEWYNFDSLYAAPERLSRFYLSAYLDSLKEFGWSIFLVRGNFPKEFLTLSTEAYNKFGQWFTPEDAQRITESCNSARPAHPQGANSQPSSRPRQPSRVERSLSDIENENLEAAIAASLMMVDSVPAIPETESICSAPVNAQTSQPTTTETGSIAESTRIPAPASGETSISSQQTTTETGSIAETTRIPAPASVETSISSQPTTTETGSIVETTRIPAPASAETSISSQLTTTETGFIAETTRIPAPVSARTSISSQPDRTETKTDVEDGKGSK